MKTSVGKTKLEIASGDITELEVDAIANAANTELWMGAGVAGAIKRVGGEAVEKEAVLQGPIEIGEAVATTGHDLKALLGGRDESERLFVELDDLVVGAADDE